MQKAPRPEIWAKLSRIEAPLRTARVDMKTPDHRSAQKADLKMYITSENVQSVRGLAGKREIKRGSGTMTKRASVAEAPLQVPNLESLF